jgi:hypothetical protein
MGIRSKLKERLFSYYLKKGMLNAIKEIEDQHKANKTNVEKAIFDINKSIQILKEEVDMFSQAIEVVEAKYGKSEEAAEISTIFPFLNLSMLDILILSKQYLSTNDKIEQNFICRTAAQHMYEFLEDGSKVLGKQIGFITDKLNNQQIDTKLKELRKSFNELKKELHTPLKRLRHNVSGHKDRDIRNQLAISNSINIDDFQENFFGFMRFFMTLTAFKRLAVDEIKKQQPIKSDTTTANN